MITSLTTSLTKGPWSPLHVVRLGVVSPVGTGGMASQPGLVENGKRERERAKNITMLYRKVCINGYNILLWISLVGANIMKGTKVHNPRAI